jgi:hypothetical protein
MKVIRRHTSPSTSTHERPSRAGNKAGVTSPAVASRAVTAWMLWWMPGGKIRLTRCSTARRGPDTTKLWLISPPGAGSKLAPSNPS